MAKAHHDSSPKVPTYDLKPEMSAQNVVDAIINEIDNELPILSANFANPDMVGHTGYIKQLQMLYKQLINVHSKLLKRIKKDYGFMIIADHGNADFMINNDGTPNTAHTTNLVLLLD